MLKSGNDKEKLVEGSSTDKATAGVGVEESKEGGNSGVEETIKLNLSEFGK